MKLLFKIAIVVSICVTFVSCSKEPKPIIYGTDACSFCKMTIVDRKFGGVIVSKTGKNYKFDDVQCIVEFIKNKYLLEDKVESTYFTDYLNGQYILANTSTELIQSENFKSPMGSNIAAFTTFSKTDLSIQELNGNILTWEEVKQLQ